MLRSPAILLCLVALTLLPVTASGQVGFYARSSTLQQTMLAARASLQRWQSEQQAARRAVKWDLGSVLRCRTASN